MIIGQSQVCQFFLFFPQPFGQIDQKRTTNQKTTALPNKRLKTLPLLFAGVLGRQPWDAPDLIRNSLEAAWTFVEGKIHAAATAKMNLYRATQQDVIHKINIARFKTK